MNNQFKEEELRQELNELREKVKKQEFINPRDMRRISEIESSLFTRGQSTNVRFVQGKPRESNRVTSFTRNRR